MIPVRGFAGKTVAVFGLARTGLAAARALLAGGARVVLWDEKAASREAAKAEGFELLDLTTADWSQLSALMLSPGVPLTHPEPHWTVKKCKCGSCLVIFEKLNSSFSNGLSMFLNEMPSFWQQHGLGAISNLVAQCTHDGFTQHRILQADGHQ